MVNYVCTVGPQVSTNTVLAFGESVIGIVLLMLSPYFWFKITAGTPLSRW